MGAGGGCGGAGYEHNSDVDTITLHNHRNSYIKKGKRKLIVQLLFHMYFILREEDTILEGGGGGAGGGVNLFKQQGQKVEIGGRGC